MAEIPKPDLSNDVAKLSDDKYAQLVYELVMRENLISEKELDRILYDVYCNGEFGYKFLYKSITLNCSVHSNINRDDEMTNAVSKGIVAGFLRGVFVMNQASIQGKI